MATRWGAHSESQRSGWWCTLGPGCPPTTDHHLLHSSRCRRLKQLRLSTSPSVSRRSWWLGLDPAAQGLSKRITATQRRPLWSPPPGLERSSHSLFHTLITPFNIIPLFFPIGFSQDEMVLFVLPHSTTSSRISFQFLIYFYARSLWKITEEELTLRTCNKHFCGRRRQSIPTALWWWAAVQVRSST